MSDALTIARTIAAEIGATPSQVTAAAALLDDGATVPFVARYRKEATGGLDDTQLRKLAERLAYLREFVARRAAVRSSITEQGKMTPALDAALAAATTKAEVEDIYLPFKPKRRTKAMIARENGLGPLAEAILANRGADPAALAVGFVTGAVADTKAALEGARDILAEGLSENAGLLGRLRAHMKTVGRLSARVVAGKEAEGAKFADYFAHDEPWATAPSHRVLAMLRGQNEGFLTLDLSVDPEAAKGDSPAERMCAASLSAHGRGLGDQWLRDAAAWAWRVKLRTSLTLDLMPGSRPIVARPPAGAASRRSRRLRAKTRIASASALSRTSAIRSSVSEVRSLTRQAQAAASRSHWSPCPRPWTEREAAQIRSAWLSPFGASGSTDRSSVRTPSFCPRSMASTRWLGAVAQGSSCAK